MDRAGEDGEADMLAGARIGGGELGAVEWKKFMFVLDGSGAGADIRKHTS